MPMAPMSYKCNKKEAAREAWTAEEDQKLSQVIEIQGPRRWRSVAAKAGLNRCGKSCRLRWMNYLRPNIKRGNISDQEEDLILRLHKLLGNRLPGRTDNEIKNYWNSHLSKKIKQDQKQVKNSTSQESESEKTELVMQIEIVAKESEEGNYTKRDEDPKSGSVGDDFFDFYSEGPLNLEWMSKFLESDESWIDLL
ncbi:hypothetical protein GH714_037498 [Hevea brasiliensis]|uniref:Uncharacterized protein n=1 Tax=Hevea brasiliensis TaxID=3981 RepID=A0A6A6KAA2_HEVBR|nr:hypothetical protein GH714_037498 [Hevea brasiliensis]